MSIEMYDKLVSTIQIDKAIAESENEIANGAELVDAKDVFASLRRKYNEKDNCSGKRGRNWSRDY